MSQYPIPQFIEQEGKIIFFLTFKQFFWLTGGIAASMLLYFVLPTSIFLTCAIGIMIFVSVIAFVKVNNGSIIMYVLSIFGFLLQDKKYTWTRKEASYVSKSSPETVKPAFSQGIHNTPEVLAPTMQPSKLQKIRKMIDTKK